MALTICPCCQGKLNKPITLPCGITICIDCTPKLSSKCIQPTCDRQHNISSLQPNVTIQQMQACITSYEASHSLDALRSSLNLTSECPICCNHFVNATTTLCGHTFCRNCLIRSLDHQRFCPFCRESLESCPAPTQILVHILSQLYIDEQQQQEDDEPMELFNSDQQVPLLIGNLAFPHINCAIHVFEPRYRLMLRRIMSTPRRRFAMCLARRKRSENDPPFYEYGTMLELMHVQTLSDGRSIVEAVGSHRFKVNRFELTDGYHVADIERIDDVDREQENILEQQQILKASALRVRQQQQQQQQQQLPAPSSSSAPIVRPASMRPPSMMVRPSASMMAKPASMMARPPRPASMSATGSMMRPNMMRPQQQQMIGQRQSWAQQAHPQTQPQVSKAPWLQMHVRGLSAARSKPQSIPTPPVRPQQPQPQPQSQPQSQPQLPIQITEKVIKHRQEQSTEELVNELVEFIDKLIQHKNANPNDSMATWMNALGEPPVLRGPSRDRVIITWWIVNMMPLGEEEKYSLLPMRSLRERVLTIIGWVDRFEDQWSLFLNNPSSSSSSKISCCIS